MADDQTILLTSASKALKFDDDLAALKALVTMVENLPALLAKVNDATTAEALLSTLAADLNSAEIATAFADLGLGAALTTLKGFLGKVTDAAGKIPKQYVTLLSRLGNVADGDSKVAWTLATPDHPEVKTDRYGLDLGASATVAFDSAGKWPGDPTGKLLTLAAEGKVTADATATVPYALGPVKAGASGKVDAALRYYFNAAQDQLYALAVAARLGALVDPFDYASVWKALQTPDLEGITIDFAGEASANMQVSVADAAALASGVKIDAGATVAVSASLKSQYALRLRRAVSDTGAPALSVHLSRDRVRGADFSAALTLGVDLSTLTKPVLDALTRAIGEWDAALKEIRPFLSPGMWLRQYAVDFLTPRVTALVGDPGLRDAILADMKGALGLEATDDALVQWLSGQIGGAIDRGSAFATGQAGSAIDRVMAALTKALPASVQSDAEGALKKLVSDGIDKLNAELKAAVGRALATPGDALKAALQKAGGVVDGWVASADAALKPVRDLLSRYDAILQKVYAAAEKAAKTKVTARLSFEESRSDETIIEIGGLFTAPDVAGGAGPKPSDVYRVLTRGTLQALIGLLEQPRSVPGFVLDPASSASQSSLIKSTQGLDLVFLGIAVSAQTLLSSQVKVVVNAQGDVQVDLEGELKKSLSLFNDRSVSFIDAYALAWAARTRTLSVGIGATYSDKSLHWQDVADFIQGLESAALVSPGATAAAKTAFTGWAPGGGAIVGDLAANLKLAGAQVEALMQLTHLVDGKLDETARQAVVHAGVKALGDCGGMRSDFFNDGASLVKGAFTLRPAPATVEQIILQYRQGLKPIELPYYGQEDDTGQRFALEDVPGEGWPDPSDRQKVFEFYYESRALEHLVGLVQQMGVIYQAAPKGAGGVPGGWGVSDYQSAQRKMLEASELWLRTGDNLVALLFSAKVSRRTISFMRAMADLAGVARPGGVVVTMTFHPDEGDPQTVSIH